MKQWDVAFLRWGFVEAYCQCPGMRVWSSPGIRPNHPDSFYGPTQRARWGRVGRVGCIEKREETRDWEESGSWKRWFASLTGEKTSGVTTINSGEIPRHAMLGSLESVTVRDRPATDFDFYVNAGVSGWLLRQHHEDLRTSFDTNPLLQTRLTFSMSLWDISSCNEARYLNLLCETTREINGATLCYTFYYPNRTDYSY